MYQMNWEFVNILIKNINIDPIYESSCINKINYIDLRKYGEKNLSLNASRRNHRIKVTALKKRSIGIMLHRFTILIASRRWTSSSLISSSVTFNAECKVVLECRIRGRTIFLCIRYKTDKTSSSDGYIIGVKRDIE